MHKSSNDEITQNHNPYSTNTLNFVFAVNPIQLRTVQEKTVVLRIAINCRDS
jgi:hypothetical protein